MKVDQGSSITIVMVDADPEDSLVTMTPVLGEAGLGGEHIVEFQYTGSALSNFLRHDEAFAISANGTTLNVAVEAQ